ncbi:MAG: hypothetical protein M1820_001748 [Bogoriella megaspora]|nr:MAG: hypothetical protein M1820_001748 [Bogoriella megaspora]
MVNQAAWLTGPKEKPLKVDSAPDAKPGPGEVVIQNAAVAINPVDWKIQDLGLFLTEYPSLLGSDSAGTIYEVGPGVTHLKKGDRVIAHTSFLLAFNTANASFQSHPLAPANVVSPIPSSLPFTQAAVLPLAISTATHGLYGQLGLPLPPASASEASKPGSAGTLVVWGGSTSVGSVGIQLAVASGLYVISTASQRNFEFVRSLGAKAIADYNSGIVVADVVRKVKEIGGQFKGVYNAFGGDTTELCTEIVEQLGGGVVASVTPGEEGKSTQAAEVKSIMAPITAKDERLATGIWGNFVPAALADGRLKAKPDAIIIKGGLGKIQEGLDTLKQGISAGKIVVDLES